jgi:hypothetical protein
LCHCAESVGLPYDLLGANHALIEVLADKGRQIQLVYIFIINVLLGEIGSIEGLNADLASVLL